MLPSFRACTDFLVCLPCYSSSLLLLAKKSSDLVKVFPKCLNSANSLGAAVLLFQLSFKYLSIVIFLFSHVLLITSLGASILDYSLESSASMVLSHPALALDQVSSLNSNSLSHLARYCLVFAIASHVRISLSLFHQMIPLANLAQVSQPIYHSIFNSIPSASLVS